MLDPRSLAARAVLVIAPHPDDESLGCGGLVASLAPGGCRFHTVFVTDGGASHRNSPSWPRPRLARQREAEAVEALSRLGVANHGSTFLRLPDAAMPAKGTPSYAAALEALAGVVRLFRPDLALLPWRRDPHCDHRDAWTLARDAISTADAPVETLEYAIWLDELGAPDDQPRTDEMERVVFDIAPAVSKKRHAVAAHLTQTTALIDDDPDAFRLTPATIERLTGREEVYWKPRP